MNVYINTYIYIPIYIHMSIYIYGRDPVFRKNMCNTITRSIQMCCIILFLKHASPTHMC